MLDIRREKTLVSQLDIGMFVCELDRSWLGTPFLLEGLLIENKTEIATLKKLCMFVYIDHTLSVGNHYIAPAKPEKTALDVKISYQKNSLPNKENSSSVPRRHSLNEAIPKFSFLEILKEIKASNQVQATLNQKNNQNTLNLNSQVKATSKAVTYQESEEKNPSIATYIQSDFT